MSTIEPGTPVRVIIEGEVTERDDAWGLTKISGAGMHFTLSDANLAPDLQVVAVDPDRPTRRELLELHRPRPFHQITVCLCGWTPTIGDTDIVSHLEAVLKNWEKS